MATEPVLKTVESVTLALGVRLSLPPPSIIRPCKFGSGKLATYCLAPRKDEDHHISGDVDGHVSCGIGRA